MTQARIPDDRSGEALRRYIEAAARIRSAVGRAPGLAYDPAAISIGLDLTRSDIRGLSELLVSKGIATIEEILESLAVSATREADQAEARARKADRDDGAETTLTTKPTGDPTE